MLLEVKNLKKTFFLQGVSKSQGKEVHALYDVSFSIKKGETIGVVGESGSGKTTLGKVIAKLLPPTSGEIIWKEKDITNISEKKNLSFRKEMQIIFQDPFSSLNPRWKVGSIIGEGLKNLTLNINKDTLEHEVLNVMKLVGLDQEMINSYPHEFSGGQRQRIAIARAILLKPEFIICDEIVSALDVSIRGLIINLLKDLKDKFSLTYFFISHDIKLTNMISDRIFIMKSGKIVEILENGDIERIACHPYTRSLLEAVPTLQKV